MDTREMPELFKVGLYRICDGSTIGIQLLLTGGSAIVNSIAEWMASA